MGRWEIQHCLNQEQQWGEQATHSYPCQQVTGDPNEVNCELLAGSSVMINHRAIDATDGILNSGIQLIFNETL